MVWNMSKAARAVAGAMLSATLALGGMAPGMAFAEVNGGIGKGKLIINRAAGNTIDKYKAIMIFSADVEEKVKDTWVASDLRWASDDVKTTVEHAIAQYIHDRNEDSDPNNNIPVYTGKTAQDAADFMADYITGTTNTSIVKPEDFANTLANYMAGALIEGKLPDDTSPINIIGVTKDLDPTPADSANATENTLTEGYYIIINNPNASTPTGNAESAASTSPILLMMGDTQTINIDEKVTIPSIEKTVQEDSTPTATTHYADAQVGQELPFNLRGTVSGNVANFKKYEYIFTDTLSKGLDLKVSGGTNSAGIDSDDVTVKIDNSKSAINAKQVYTITDGFTVTYNTADTTKKVLTIEFTNLHETKVNSTDSAYVPIDSNSVITVDYIASLNEDAVVGKSGNDNDAYITYSTIPNRDERGDTTHSKARVYEYSLKMIKLDQDHELDATESTQTKLKGAVFTIQATTTDESTSNNTNNSYFLKNDGTFGDKALPSDTSSADYNSYLFTTNDDGEINVKGLDTGTYTIHEVTPPKSYKALKNDLILTITTTKANVTGEVTEITATLTGGEADYDSGRNRGTRVAVDGGAITVYATNTKEERLPLTGLPGITAVYIVGGTILVTSLAVIVRRHLREKA